MCARAAPTKPPSASTTSKLKRSSKTNSPAASTTRSISRPTPPASTTHAPTKRVRFSISTCSARAPRATSLVFGHEFYDEPLGPIDLFNSEVTHDGHYLIVTIERGVPAKRVDIVFRDLTKPESPFNVLVWGIDSRFAVVYAKGAWFVKTDYKAPKGCIQRADPGVDPTGWKTIAPESNDVIAGFSIVGEKLYVTRLKDVKSETSVYTLDGKPAGTIDYDGIGSASTVYGRPTDRYGFFSFQSFIQPPTLYRLDTLTGKREIFAQPKVPFDTADYELKQVFFKSKDGTQIPMFIAGKKGLKQDGTERLLMTGYGGFNLSMTPVWNPEWAWWLEQGGWFAMPNLRGGGEYGEAWHEAGMFEKKQNVFDDWFAAAQYLIDKKYTSPQHFAISGRSQRRTAHGRLLHPASRALLRRLVRLSAARHAALSALSSGPALDHRVRLRR